ncbi:uroporphyrinogen-III synthase [Hartmannibacter diazotrophicus]|uniref:Uroporphyrinogen-III synthase n=1 Tax=Hartmannibacter diazotrophicus TaxID=1482074 RepID=A0A2C9D0G7_9HYPH|nr:uroporphyrinogen-III synthase [Hartmannibacter diazotrophicus]
MASILILRPEREAARMAKEIRRHGHECRIAPMLEIVPVGGWPETVPELPFAAVILTSANAVANPAGALPASLLEASALCVGRSTADAAKEAGFQKVVSVDGTADDLLAHVLATLRPEDGPLLYLAGRDRTADLETRLEEAGFRVVLLETYRAEKRRRLDAETLAGLRAGRLDIVVTASARTSATFAECLAADAASEVLGDLAIAAISEAAALPLVRAGAVKVSVADRPSGDSLLSQTLSLAETIARGKTN